jgi:putative transposase
MSDRFQNKYRIESAQLKHWDYGKNAMYFLTIYTQNREYFFGDVVYGNMVLNNVGEIANDCRLEIPTHFPFVKLKNHVVMPNHIHGIVMIDKPDDGRFDGRNVETQNFASLQPYQPDSNTKNQFGPQSKNLASIVRGFKIGVTKNARLINPDFAWQTRFHDHIIRNDESFHRISEYIINNPGNWSKDQFS